VNRPIAYFQFGTRPVHDVELSFLELLNSCVNLSHSISCFAALLRSREMAVASMLAAADVDAAIAACQGKASRAPLGLPGIPHLGKH